MVLACWSGIFYKQLIGLPAANFKVGMFFVHANEVDTFIMQSFLDPDKTRHAPCKFGLAQKQTSELNNSKRHTVCRTEKPANCVKVVPSI